MKHILSAVLILFSVAAFSQSGVGVTGPVQRLSSTDRTYGTHFDSLGYGGYMAVSSIASRDSIPHSQYRIGMQVSVLNDSVYILQMDSTWVGLYLSNGQGVGKQGLQNVINNNPNLVKNNYINSKGFSFTLDSVGGFTVNDYPSDSVWQSLQLGNGDPAMFESINYSNGKSENLGVTTRVITDFGQAPTYSQSAAGIKDTLTAFLSVVSPFGSDSVVVRNTGVNLGLGTKNVRLGAKPALYGFDSVFVNHGDTVLRYPVMGLTQGLQQVSNVNNITTLPLYAKGFYAERFRANTDSLLHTGRYVKLGNANNFVIDSATNTVTVNGYNISFSGSNGVFANSFYPTVLQVEGQNGWSLYNSNIGSNSYYTTIHANGSGIYRTINLPDSNGTVALLSNVAVKQRSMYINVMDYGADSTGVNDCTTAIQKAYNAVPAQGGTVFFPSGRFLCGKIYVNNRTITIGTSSPAYYNTVSFVFAADSLGTVIRDTSATDTLFVVGAQSCKFENITIQNTSTTTASSGSAISFLQANNFEILNTTIRNFYNGITVKNGFSWHIGHCAIYDNVNFGVSIFSQSPLNDLGDWTIDGGTIFHANVNAATASAINWQSSGGGKISNTKFYGFKNCIDAPFILGTSLLQVTNCSFEGYTGYGIHLYPQSATTFSRIMISNNEFYPIYALSGQTINITGRNTGQIAISNNVFSDNGMNAGVAAIRIDSSSNITVHNNTYVGYTLRHNFTHVSAVDTSSSITTGGGGSLFGYINVSRINAGNVDNGYTVQNGGTMWQNKDSIPIVTGQTFQVVYDTVSKTYKRQLISTSGAAIGGIVGSATAGSVFYAGTGGTLQQSNNYLFYDSTNKRLGLLTNSPTHTFTIGSGGQSATYNTTDQTTNYARNRQYWSSNTFNIVNEAGGTGTAGNILIGVSGRTFISNNVTGNTGFLRANAAIAAGAVIFSADGNITNSSSVAYGNAAVLNVTATGTAGYSALAALVNETSTGSGNNYLLDLATTTLTNGTGTKTTKYSVDHSGNSSQSGTATIGTIATGSVSNNILVNGGSGLVNQISPTLFQQQSVSAASGTTGTVSQPMGNNSGITVTPTGNITFNATGGTAGQHCVFYITTSGTTSYTITWGTNFLSTGTLSTGTVSGKHYKVTMDYDGTNWYASAAVGPM